MTEIRCRVEVRNDATRESPGRLTGTLLTYGERAADRPRYSRPARWSGPTAALCSVDSINAPTPS